MRRGIGRLTALAVSKAKKKGMYADGGGLYLHVSDQGAKSWIYRFTLNGRQREMGLGGLNTISFAEARDMALECRKLRRDGIDPIEARRARRQSTQLAAAKTIAFKECAEAYIAAHRAGWSNAKHARQWSSSFEAYCYPHFGRLPVAAIDVGLVMKAIEPGWSTKPETMSRVRGRVENVLDWATTRGYRHGDNPARWKGHIENLLPRKRQIRATRHYDAMKFAEVPGFLARLRQEQTIIAPALEFAILTAARRQEVLGARWSEIDLAEKIWTVPAERMKLRREHRVPLSLAAIALLDRLPRDGEFVFPGKVRGTHLSQNVMLHRAWRENVTVHGFRSSFRDWAAECTNFPREVAEMALAHAIADQVEAAYRRGDLFGKRRQLMDAWGRYCSSPLAGSAVVAIRAQA